MIYKDTGKIFENYFTRAIKLTISQALSAKTYDESKMSDELTVYLEDQIDSPEIPMVSNNVNFYLENNDGSWVIVNEDKDLVSVVLPNLLETINNLAETYGEYGD